MAGEVEEGCTQSSGPLGHLSPGPPSLPSWDHHLCHVCHHHSIPLPRKAEMWITVLSRPSARDLGPPTLFSKFTCFKVGGKAGKTGGFGYQSMRAHDSTALTCVSKTQGSCLSHTCEESALCRQHSIGVPTGQALTELWAWLGELGMLSTGQTVPGLEHWCEKSP